MAAYDGFTKIGIADSADYRILREELLEIDEEAGAASLWHITIRPPDWYTSFSGGTNNTTSWCQASVSGGDGNTDSATDSIVSGGLCMDTLC